MAGSYSRKITASAVNAIKANGTHFDVRDTDLRGFHIRVTPGDGKFYRYQYQRPNGSRAVMKIGRVSELTPDEARAVARKFMVDVAAGRDPRGEKSAWKAAPTVQDLWDIYERDRLSLKNRPRTHEQYKGNWERHIKRHLGEKKVADVSRKDVLDIVRRMGTKRVTANRVVALVSVLFNFAIEHELRETNPAYKVKKYKEQPRDIVYTNDELSRIGAALENEPELWARTALKLIIITGARSIEVLGMEWSELDLNSETPTWRIPAARFKGGHTHEYGLDEDAVALIRAWRSDAPFLSAKWVFPNMSGKNHRRSVQKWWKRVQAEAKVTRGVLHSFRHTFFTRAAESGASAIDIKNLAGHKDIQTSMRYIHAQDQLRTRQVSQTVRNAIRKAIQMKPVEAEVVQLGR
jgi:integrase